MNKTKHMRLTGEGEHVMSYEWDNLDEFLEDVEEMKHRGTKCDSIEWHKDEGKYGWINGGNAWYGCESADRFFQHLHDGWPQLREQLLKMVADCNLELQAIPNRTTIRRRKRHHTDHGDELLMGKVWNGELDTAWVTPRRADVHTVTTKRITLAIDMSTPSAMTNDQCMWRAALALALCDKLQAAGRVFEVWTTSQVDSPYQEQFYGRLLKGFCVKRSQDPLILDKLCSMLSVGFYRSCDFWAYHVPGWAVQEGYGQLYDSNKQLPATLAARQEAGEAVLHVTECYTRDQMMAECHRAWKEVSEVTEEVLRGYQTR